MRKPHVRLLASAVLSLALALTALALPAGAHPDPRRHTHLDSSAAVVAPPLNAVTRTLSPVQGCRALLVRGDGDCTLVETSSGALVVTVEPGAPIDDVLASRPWSVSVYRPSAAVPDGWELALATHPELGEPGPLYAAVTARAADVTGDGADELVLGYRHEGTGMILDLDVVGTDADGTPRVLAHDVLYKASVVFRGGTLVAYTPVYKRADANCCPTWVARDVLRHDAGVFSVDRVARTRTGRLDVPRSQLG